MLKWTDILYITLNVNFFLICFSQFGIFLKKINKNKLKVD